MANPKQTQDAQLRKAIAAALNKTMNPGAVNAAMENVWPVMEEYFNTLPTFIPDKNPLDMLGPERERGLRDALEAVAESAPTVAGDRLREAVNAFVSHTTDNGESDLLQIAGGCSVCHKLFEQMKALAAASPAPVGPKYEPMNNPSVLSQAIHEERDR